MVQIAFLGLFLILLFYFCRPYRYDYSKEGSELFKHLELFLVLDPLVSISASIASKTFVWSLTIAAAVMLIGTIFPRWFCGYVCPMGTLIDLFDWSIGRRVKLFRIKPKSWLVNLRFCFLTAVLVSSLFGILISGFVSAIPVITRGMLYIFALLQPMPLKGWEYLPQLSIWHYVSIFLFLAILSLGFLRPGFWCAYICPSGALLSLASLLRLNERKVEDTCVKCGRCLSACDFGAIASDFTTRPLECTFCMSCADVCPKNSIKFVSRWNDIKEKSSDKNSNLQPSYARRNFLVSVIGAAGVGTGIAAGLKPERGQYANSFPMRPPGSVPEDVFRGRCIRCGECLKACPVSILQPTGMELGFDGIWTPVVKIDSKACQPYCNNCGQACPTGAIRALSIDEKRAARMAQSEVDKSSCLAHCKTQECGLCVEECKAAGYNALEYIRVGIQYDNWGMPIEDSGFLAPVVIEEKCVGCGLCQVKCHAENVKELGLLKRSAIIVKNGLGKEDRIIKGSYKQLQAERINKKRQLLPAAPKNDYLPDFLR
ncbi:MAG: 4Fe-4S binding protein [Sedimentisphaerales bacterium]|nr:4Fe-4S binding protein [Sedimentisphaerales bacterium]